MDNYSESVSDSFYTDFSSYYKKRVVIADLRLSDSNIAQFLLALSEPDVTAELPHILEGVIRNASNGRFLAQMETQLGPIIELDPATVLSKCIFFKNIDAFSWIVDNMALRQTVFDEVFIFVIDNQAHLEGLSTTFINKIITKADVTKTDKYGVAPEQLLRDQRRNDLANIIETKKNNPR